MNYSEELQIPFTHLEVLAEANLGYSQYLSNLHFHDEGMDSKILAATCLVRAACYYSIIDQQMASHIYKSASLAYSRLGRPYAYLLAICSGDLNFYRSFELTIPFSKCLQDPTFAITLILMRQTNHPFLEKTHSIDISSMPTLAGRLRLPMIAYHQLFNQSNSSLDTLQSFLEMASAPVTFAQRRERDWSKQMLTVLPIEPEILATLICLHNVEKLSNISTIQINPVAKSWLSIADRMTKLGLEGKDVGSQEKYE